MSGRPRRGLSPERPMRSSKPRIVPLEEKDWNDEQRQLLAPMAQGGRVPNIFKTLVRHPKLLKRWLPFANHILFKSSLAPREREMLILRVAWVARAEYEWGDHQEIGHRAGLRDAAISWPPGAHVGGDCFAALAMTGR